MQRDHIGLVHGAGVDTLGGLHLRHRLDPVAQSGGALVFHRLGGLGHLRRQLFLNLGRAAGKIAFGIADLCCIVGAADLAHAGGGAPLDLELQTGARAALEHGVRAIAQLKHALQLRERSVDSTGTGEGTVIGALFPLGAAMLLDHREVMRSHEDVGKALVVAQEHVVTRLELLDEVLLKQERLGFGRGREKHHRRSFRNHPRDTPGMAGGPGIVRHARPQIARLAHVWPGLGGDSGALSVIGPQI